LFNAVGKFYNRGSLLFAKQNIRKKLHLILVTYKYVANSISAFVISNTYLKMQVTGSSASSLKPIQVEI